MLKATICMLITNDNDSCVCLEWTVEFAFLIHRALHIHFYSTENAANPSDVAFINKFAKL